MGENEKEKELTVETEKELTEKVETEKEKEIKKQEKPKMAYTSCTGVSEQKLMTSTNIISSPNLDLLKNEKTKSKIW